MPRGSLGDGEAVAVLSKVAVDIVAVEGEARFPDLLRGLDIEWPNHVWCADITYIPAHRGFLLAARPTLGRKNTGAKTVSWRTSSTCRIVDNKLVPKSKDFRWPTWRKVEHCKAR